MNKKDINTDHWVAQHCTLDKTDKKHNMQRKKQRDSCLIPHVVVSSSFPCQEMPNEIRAVLEAIWAGELEVLRSTSCGLIFLVIICWKRALLCITKGAACGLEVRNAMMECGLTLKMNCETDVSVGRAVAT